MDKATKRKLTITIEQWDEDGGTRTSTNYKGDRVLLKNIYKDALGFFIHTLDSPEEHFLGLYEHRFGA